MSDSTQAEDPSRLTRAVATLVLLPTVPLLLFSVAALALFYVAPGRFAALLARLPGDEFIRTVLIFAPATLLAVVVLAGLYALERPEAPAKAAAPSERAAPRVGMNRLVLWGLLAPGLPLLTLAVGLWLFSFIAPNRFALFLEPLPGDAYLRQGLHVAPLLLLAVVVPAALFLLLGRGQRARAGGPDTHAGRPVRWGVALTLVATVPLFAFSLAALGLFYFDPARFGALLDRLTAESFVRLALVFTPAVLLSLVLLAVLFLFFSRPRAEQADPEEPGQAAERELQRTRERLALWVLTGGLAGSAVVALGVLSVAVFLLLR